MQKLLKQRSDILKILASFICVVIVIINCISLIKVNDIEDPNEQMYEEVKEKITLEGKIYKELIDNEYETQNSKNPYIPEGFSYVEGTWENGYVIQDENQNQYVWVPCSNNDSEELVKLERMNRCNMAFISYNSCYNEGYEEFLKSALENGGFYISRYEIGKEENIPVSKANIEIWNNITKEEAKEIVSTMYDTINCELINGYAYDTTLKWVEKTNEIKIKENIIKFEKDTKIFTGRKSNNNIYDFCDNVLEYSLENLYDTTIIRGFIGSDSIEYTANSFSEENRYCILPEEKSYGVVIPIAMRTILYK